MKKACVFTLLVSSMVSLCAAADAVPAAKNAEPAAPAAALVIMNGSFEKLQKPNANQKWTFASDLMPSWWSFSKGEGNLGTLTIVKESPADGENAIRVEKKGSTYPQFAQSLRGTLVKKYSFTISVRGKGDFEVRSDGMKNQRFSVSTKENEWKEISGEFMPGRQKAFVIRLINGTLDFDNVKIAPLADDAANTQK